ncbi:shikimate dehydrogenase [Thermoanaerobacterium sp. DL9XJH110]|uniref:shikimate dehydrogenase n=1 Tax=Thermoanaerobacterium sp. DL9XJH110 TaxID=3386643 RepID=UPI003BB5B900
MNISVDTKLLGLFGNPLSFTLSPMMHNSAFEMLNLNYLYIPFEVKPENFEDVIKSIKYLNFIGGNVTSPFKTAIIKYLDEIDDKARLIGAVNVIKFENNKLKGFNTDGDGFVRSLKQEKKVDPKNKNILILGCGGAARAVAITLAMCEPGNIYIANRTFNKAVDLVIDINNIRHCAIPIKLESNELKKINNNVDILINTTKVGMYPDINAVPVDEDVIHKKMIVCDIVYNPIHTKLLQIARSKGCEILTGVGMMVNQGVESFKIWTGIEPPVEKLYDIVNKELIKRQKNYESL